MKVFKIVFCALVLITGVACNEQGVVEEVLLNLSDVNAGSATVKNHSPASAVTGTWTLATGEFESDCFNAEDLEESLFRKTSQVNISSGSCSVEGGEIVSGKSSHCMVGGTMFNDDSGFLHRRVGATRCFVEEQYVAYGDFINGDEFEGVIMMDYIYYGDCPKRGACEASVRVQGARGSWNYEDFTFVNNK